MKTIKLAWVVGGECCADCCVAADGAAAALGLRGVHDVDGREDVTPAELAAIDAAVTARECCDPRESHRADGE